MTAKTQTLSESEVHAAQRYLDSLLEQEDTPLSPDEIESIQSSIEAIRRGEMTLTEFERKHGL